MIRANRFGGEVVYYPRDLSRSHLNITVLTGSLEVLTPPDTAEIRKVTETMRTEVLRTAEYPDIRLVSRQVAPSADGFHIVGAMTLVGQTRDLPIEVTARIGVDTLEAASTFSLKQTDFGIKPFSGGPGGTVKVADRVTFDIRAVAVREAQHYRSHYGTKLTGWRRSAGLHRSAPPIGGAPGSKARSQRCASLGPFTVGPWDANTGMAAMMLLDSGDATKARLPDSLVLDSCILIVDDSREIRHLVTRALREAQYAVLEAGDGALALQILEHGGVHVDLVLTDIRMPRLDGVELGRRIAARQRRIPVLYMTGSAGEDIIPNSADLLLAPLLRKPFPMSTLVDTVGRMLVGDVRGEPQSSIASFG